MTFAITTIIAIIVVLIALVLIVLGMRALSLGQARTDDLDEYEDEDAGSERGEGPEPAPRSRRRRASPEPEQEAPQRTGRSRRKRSSWDDDEGLSGNSFWSSLAEDAAAVEDGADGKPVGQETRVEPDQEDRSAPADDERGEGPEPAPRSRRRRASPEPERAAPASHATESTPSGPIDDPDVAMLASLGNGAGSHSTAEDAPAPTGHESPVSGEGPTVEPLRSPSAASSPGESWQADLSGRRDHAVPPADTTAHQPDRHDPLTGPTPSSEPAFPQPSPYDTGSYARPSYGGTPQVRPDTGTGASAFPSPYDTGTHSRPPYGADPAAPSPYDTGSYARPSYGGTPQVRPDTGTGASAFPSPYDTGTHSRPPYGADPAAPSPYDTGMHSRPQYGSASPSSYSLGGFGGPAHGDTPGSPPFPTAPSETDAGWAPPAWPGTGTSSYYPPAGSSPSPNSASHPAGPSPSGYDPLTEYGGGNKPQTHDTGGFPYGHTGTNHQAAGGSPVSGPQPPVPPGSTGAASYPAADHSPSPGVPAPFHGGTAETQQGPWAGAWDSSTGGQQSYPSYSPTSPPSSSYGPDTFGQPSHGGNTFPPSSYAPSSPAPWSGSHLPGSPAPPHSSQPYPDPANNTFGSYPSETDPSGGYSGLGYGPPSGERPPYGGPVPDEGYHSYDPSWYGYGDGWRY
ncbi:hypothetical protein FHX37_1343 [Haloactinospora alba]|uniref:Uncharacterized protein n=1 Tax=Haloactinospora alba TaxID=405555 RepID=A0A543NHZ7_9ACTN|nr:hypothetical protein [Haloactinospora alba]TQN31439.1 hypothetical protein FHX37_1343 [Haloactinospora alba]